ncbi:MAG: hypothetical protein B6244_03920 [Candidatus Cloacimonetes bacterium 4572_55]|nr:MAG: hypothetical protein B6244_03920 [Candidatus Cloacimonetes bacterium 4572_55]
MSNAILYKMEAPQPKEVIAHDDADGSNWRMVVIKEGASYLKSSPAKNYSWHKGSNSSRVIRLYLSQDPDRHRLEKAVQEQTEKLQRQNEDLMNQVEELTRENQNKKDLIGLMGHDLQNPLTAVMIYTELIQDILKKDARDALKKVDNLLKEVKVSSDQIHHLIINILNASQLDQGKNIFQINPVDLSQIAQKAVAKNMPMAEQKHMSLEYSSSAVSYRMQADSNWLLQILDNLISNAIKYSPCGKQVFVRVMKKGDFIRCEVEDQGPGLTNKDKEKLFGKHCRLSATPTGGERSSGLGLYFAKKFTTAMEGKVWCESSLKNGAKFIVEFPIDID